MRLNPIIILGIIGIAVIGMLLFMSGRSPDSVGEAFMEALAKKDVKKLAELSFLERPTRPLEQQWDECVNKHARTYNFVWVWEGSHTETDEQAIMRIHLIEFKGAQQGETETFEMPLVKVNGQWKVDLVSLSRKFFPGLPE